MNTKVIRKKKISDSFQIYSRFCKAMFILCSFVSLSLSFRLHISISFFSGVQNLQFFLLSHNLDLYMDLDFWGLNSTPCHSFDHTLIWRRSSQVRLVEKNLPASAGAVRDTSLIPGSERSLGRGHSNHQYSYLENPTDRGAWWATDPDAGKDWGQEEKGMTEDETGGWHHRLSGHGFGWTPGVGDGQGGLACCSSWGRKESDTTERLNWTENK